MNTAVIITTTQWNEAPRIRHQIARQLARFYRVLFVETPTSWSQEGSNQIPEEVASNIWRYRLRPAIKPLRRLKNYSSIANWIVNTSHINELNRVLEQFPGNYILFNFNCDFIEIMRWDLFCLKVYFCNDNFASMATNMLSRQITIQRQTQVATTAHLCLAVSYPLVDSLKTINSNTLLFLPGHEVEREKINIPSRDSHTVKVVFMGYINRRLEFNWLEYAAAQTDIEVHLVGPVQIGESPNNPIEIDRSLYERLKQNIFFYEPMYGEDLSRFLSKMDVCCIPYTLKMEANIAITTSNKFFTYLALGKPIVISDLPHYIDVGAKVTYRAKSKESFVAQIRNAMEEDSEQLRQKRFKIADENTWQKRGDNLKEIIDRNLKFVAKPKKQIKRDL